MDANGGHHVLILFILTGFVNSIFQQYYVHRNYNILLEILFRNPANVKADRTIILTFANHTNSKILLKVDSREVKTIS